MKTIIAGTRDIADIRLIPKAVAEAKALMGITVDELVSGMARGPDMLAYRWAEGKIPIKPFPAEWNKYGFAAGPLRNQKMAEYADALIAIWDGKSRGTLDMIERAKAQGLKIFVYKV